MQVTLMLQGNKTLMPVYIAVNDVGLHVITVDTKVTWCVISVMYYNVG